MAKNITSPYVPLDSIELRTRNPIRASAWREIAEGQNGAYSDYHGAMLAGVHLENPTTYEPFTYAGSGYTVFSNNGLRLDEFTPQCRFLRPLSGGDYRVFVRAYGFNALIEVKIIRSFPVTGNTITDSFHTSSGWGGKYINIPDSFIDPFSNGTKQPVRFEFRVQKRLEPDTLRLHAINIFEGPMTASQLPSSQGDFS